MIDSSVTRANARRKISVKNSHNKRRSGVARIIAESWQEVRDRSHLQLTVLCRAYRVSRATCRLVLDEIARHASYEYADCYPSEERIGERIDRSVTQVRSALRVLEALKLLETYTKQDALNVYGHNPKHDRRSNAYRVVALAEAWKCARRAVLVDKRTAWQRHHARCGWRQQRRAMLREIERISGVRPVWLPHLGRDIIVPVHPAAQGAQQSPGKPRRGQPVHIAAASPALAACAMKGPAPRSLRQEPPTLGAQHKGKQHSQSGSSGQELATTWLSRLKEARGGAPPRVPPR